MSRIRWSRCVILILQLLLLENFARHAPRNLGCKRRAFEHYFRKRECMFTFFSLSPLHVTFSANCTIFYGFTKLKVKPVVILHCRTHGLILGLVCVSRFPFPRCAVTHPAEQWEQHLLPLHLVPLGRAVTQRICIAEGEEISSGRMNHPSSCGNSCAGRKKLRKARGLCCALVC